MSKQDEVKSETRMLIKMYSSSLEVQMLNQELYCTGISNFKIDPYKMCDSESLLKKNKKNLSLLS